MKKLNFPDRITVELTNRCNVSCTFCHRQKFDMKLGDMQEDLFYKIIDEASEHLPIKLVLFFRGESLLVDKLIDYIKYAKGKGIGPIQLASNALILSHKLAEELIDSEIDFISFSLDTIDDELYKSSRRAGDLKTSMDNVKYMGSMCREYARDGKKVPTLQVSTIDLDIYREKQEEFIEYWLKYVDIVRVYYEHDEKGRLVNKEVFNSVINDDDRKPCKKVFTDMLIYWDGRIALCCYDWNQKIPIGDVNKQSLQEIWDGKVFEEIRTMHNENCFSDDLLCKECHHWKIDYLSEKYFGKIYQNK